MTDTTEFDLFHAAVPESGIDVRDVTSDECDFYYQNGWVKLPQLISHEDAAQLREVGEQLAQSRGNLLESESYKRGSFEVWREPSQDSDLFRSVTFSPTLGRNAARLMSDPVFGPRQARWNSDTLNRKVPASHGGGRTPWHQDFPIHPYDRSGMMLFWIALVDMPAEMGTMRFMNGSHRVGQFGRSSMVATRSSGTRGLPSTARCHRRSCCVPGMPLPMTP